MWPKKSFFRTFYEVICGCTDIDNSMDNLSRFENAQYSLDVLANFVLNMLRCLGQMMTLCTKGLQLGPLQWSPLDVIRLIEIVVRLKYPKSD